MTSQPTSRQKWLRQRPNSIVFSNQPNNHKSNLNNRRSRKMAKWSNLPKQFSLFKVFNLFKVFKQMN